MGKNAESERGKRDRRLEISETESEGEKERVGAWVGEIRSEGLNGGQPLAYKCIGPSPSASDGNKDCILLIG